MKQENTNNMNTNNNTNMEKWGDVLVLHTPIIKYIFEIYLGIICIAVSKN